MGLLLLDTCDLQCTKVLRLIELRPVLVTLDPATLHLSGQHHNQRRLLLPHHLVTVNTPHRLGYDVINLDVKLIYEIVTYMHGGGKKMESHYISFFRDNLCLFNWFKYGIKLYFNFCHILQLSISPHFHFEIKESQ